MTISGPRLRSLLRQAEKAADSGKRAAARTLYRQILEEAPESEAAWLGLAGVTFELAEKTAVYERILQINPDNEAAKTGLTQLRGDPIPVEDEADPFEQSREWLKTATAPATEKKAAVPEPEPKPEPKPVAETAVHDHDHDHDPIAAAGDDFDLFCYRHPNRETSLRCYNCGQPICISCAVKTPVGYSCPDCIRDLQKNYYTITLLDYIIAFIVALPLSIIAAYLVGFLGFFVIFVAPVAGTLIGRIVFWAVRRRRGRWLAHLVGATVVLGAIIAQAGPFLLSVAMALLLSPEQIAAAGGMTSLLLRGGGSLIWTGFYAFLAAGAAYYFVKV